MSAPPQTLRAEARALARLAFPIAAAQAGLTLMGLVDLWVVGKLGARPIAAIGLANSIYFFGAIAGLGTVMGLDPLTSQALGARDPVRARRLLWQGVWLALGASALLILALLTTRPFLALMHVSPETASLTWTCLLIRLPSMPALLLFAVVRAYLQARHITRPMVVSTLACNVFNLCADLLFVFGGAHLPAWTGPLRHVPMLGAAGAALSTSLGTFLQLGIVAWALRSDGTGALPRGARRPVLRDLQRAVQVGLPIGLQMGAEVGVFSLVSVLAARLGDASSAAHNLALNLASFSFSIAIGVGQAGSVRVGWAVGQRDAAAVRRSGLVAFAGGLLVMGTSALIFMLAPWWLPRFYPAPREVLAVAAPLLVVAGFFQLSDGVQGVGAGVLRGAGDTLFPFLANVGGHYLIGLPIALWLGMAAGGGVRGLWWGLCCGLTAVAIALLSRFLWLSSRPIAPLEHAPQPPQPTPLEEAA